MVESVHGLTPWAHAIAVLLAGAGMLVIVPLGLSLVAAPGAAMTAVRRWWPAVALPAAVSLWLPRGPVTATLALPYLTATSVLLTGSVVELALRGQDRARSGSGRAAYGVREMGFDLAFLTALSGPVIAAGALVAERAGERLFGFGLDTLILTVVHFHYAGFAAALIAALLLDRRPGPVTTTAVWCVPGGTLVVLIGYFTSDTVELAGAALLTLGMWLTAGVTWLSSRQADRAAKALLGLGAAAAAGAMLLALDWALGRVTGLPHLTISWMVATHGAANALGFALCSLLAWRRTDRTSDVSLSGRGFRKSVSTYGARPDLHPGASNESGLLTRLQRCAHRPRRHAA
jgi:hypothetical protein